jgi:hypothetical protein
MAVFAPWAFGATQDWSVWTLNAAGYCLGALLAAKWWVRWRTGYRPARWGEAVAERGQAAALRPHTRAARWLTRSLAALSLLVLAYCLVGALNARSTFVNGTQVFNDQSLLWLPHSYSGDRTWAVFWQLLGLGCFFWALRDWLLGKSVNEYVDQKDLFAELAPTVPPPLPTRLSRLLWVLCINGTLLGVVSILQRQDGTDKLLWFAEPRWGGPDFHFGPFNYRGNGAQYFNLLWPVSLAFWWTMFRARRASRSGDARIGGDPHLVLLPLVLVQLACPIISASHGGAAITLALAIGALGFLAAANWRAAWRTRLVLIVPFVLGLGLVAYLGWGQYKAGLAKAFYDDLGDRIEIYRNARQIAVEHPLFGTGPGSFPDVYQLYRTSAAQDWAAYAHNDWLETIITYGWIGFGLLMLMLAHTLVRWWIPDGIACRSDLAGMIWLAMAGCLFHARFDFPLQVYSVLLLFLSWCAISCCISRRQA